ncbi:MAG: prepilin-type N-terminal cleavage/methylation domain-containing protein [Armatimonadetes bacterium]|nr:prepilin-type N-terminal cleavage/methylation domain-containing protein [Armatimonadota bacterium]
MQNLKLKNKGSSLIEVLVYIALFSIVFSSIYMIFIMALRYYYTTKSGIEVQQGAILAVYKLSKELNESSLASLKIYRTTSPKGIVFMSIRNPASGNQIQYSSGSLIWYKYVCFYIETDPADSTKKALFRKEQTITPTTTPASSSTYTPAWFSSGGGAGLAYEVTAHNLDASSGFDIYWGDHLEGVPGSNPIYLELKVNSESYGKINDISTSTLIEIKN